ncbi:MAG: hypothetical protein AABX48_00915 [Nanoarchaeota archaeon]
MAKEEELSLRHGLSAAIILLGVTVGLAFMSPALTGNAIGNLTDTNATGVGIAVVFASMALGFLLSRD